MAAESISPPDWSRTIGKAGEAFAVPSTSHRASLSNGIVPLTEARVKSG